MPSRGNLCERPPSRDRGRRLGQSWIGLGEAPPAYRESNMMMAMSRRGFLASIGDLGLGGLLFDAQCVSTEGRAADTPRERSRERTTMSMVLETVFTEGLAHLSYLIGDRRTGCAAVIDPRRDVEVYVDLAQTRAGDHARPGDAHPRRLRVRVAGAGRPHRLGQDSRQRRGRRTVRLPAPRAQGRRPDRPRARDPDGPAHSRPHARTPVLPRRRGQPPRHSLRRLQRRLPVRRLGGASRPAG